MSVTCITDPNNVWTPEQREDFAAGIPDAVTHKADVYLRTFDRDAKHGHDVFMPFLALTRVGDEDIHYGQHVLPTAELALAAGETYLAALQLFNDPDDYDAPHVVGCFRFNRERSVSGFVYTAREVSHTLKVS